MRLLGKATSFMGVWDKHGIGNQSRSLLLRVDDNLSWHTFLGEHGSSQSELHPPGRLAHCPHSHHPLWTLCYPLIQSPCPLSLLPIHSLHSNLHKTQRYKEFMKTCIAIIFTNFRVEVFILRIRSKGGGHLHSITDNYWLKREKDEVNDNKCQHWLNLSSGCWWPFT